MKEREVKLGAGRGFELPDLGRLHGTTATARPEQHLSTTYFDSDDFRLARWGLSFRHRAGQGWTVKLPSDGSGELLVRDEIVFKGRGGAPPAAAVDLVRGYLRDKQLLPRVRLRTTRRGILVHDPEGRLVADVVDDAVSVLDGPCGGSVFRELEVETREETPEGLLEAILSRLQKAGAGAPDPTPKYLRAIGGADAASPEFVLTAPRRPASVGEVVGHAIADGVVRLLRHDPVVRLDSDPEGVHQARVATRRLRSDLRTFRGLLDRDWVAALRDELGWLGAELGQARDADVLLARLTAHAEQLPQASKHGAGTVIEALTHGRAEAHDRLLQTLRSDRYLRLLDELVQAAQAPALRPVKTDRRASQALRPIVRRAWSRLHKTVRSLPASPSDEDLHMVRILAKRCRYAAEACAPSLGKRTHRFAHATRTLQDVLGELNDAVVSEQWLRDWAAGTSDGPGAFAAGELAALQRATAQQVRSQWGEAWQRVTTTAPEA